MVGTAYPMAVSAALLDSGARRPARGDRQRQRVLAFDASPAKPSYPGPGRVAARRQPRADATHAGRADRRATSSSTTSRSATRYARRPRRGRARRLPGDAHPRRARPDDAPEAGASAIAAALRATRRHARRRPRPDDRGARRVLAALRAALATAPRLPQPVRSRKRSRFGRGSRVTVARVADHAVAGRGRQVIARRTRDTRRFAAARHSVVPRDIAVDESQLGGERLPRA